MEFGSIWNCPVRRLKLIHIFIISMSWHTVRGLFRIIILSLLMGLDWQSWITAVTGVQQYSDPRPTVQFSSRSSGSITGSENWTSLYLLIQNPSTSSGVYEDKPSNNHWNIKANLLQRLKYNTVFCWIPGQSCIIGDRLLAHGRKTSSCRKNQRMTSDIKPLFTQYIYIYIWEIASNG